MTLVTLLVLAISLPCRRLRPCGRSPRRPRAAAESSWRPSAPTRRASTRTRSRPSPPSSRSLRSTARSCRSIPTAIRTSSATSASEWKIAPDGLTYTFKIRPGIRFHDGSPLTAADVKASYDKIIFPPEAVRSIRKHHYSAVASVEAPDPSTVVFKLKFPSASLLSTWPRHGTSSIPKKYLDKDPNYFKNNVVGSGPFKFKSYTRGSTFEGERNPDYFVKDRPYLNGYKFFISTETSVRAAAIRSGRAYIEFRDLPTGRGGRRSGSISATRSWSSDAVCHPLRRLDEQHGEAVHRHSRADQISYASPNAVNIMRLAGHDGPVKGIGRSRAARRRATASPRCSGPARASTSRPKWPSARSATGPSVCLPGRWCS